MALWPTACLDVRSVSASCSGDLELTDKGKALAVVVAFGKAFNLSLGCARGLGANVGRRRHTGETGRRIIRTDGLSVRPDRLNDLPRSIGTNWRNLVEERQGCQLFLAFKYARGYGSRGKIDAAAGRSVYDGGEH